MSAGEVLAKQPKHEGGRPEKTGRPRRPVSVAPADRATEVVAPPNGKGTASKSKPEVDEIQRAARAAAERSAKQQGFAVRITDSKTLQAVATILRSANVAKRDNPV